MLSASRSHLAFGLWDLIIGAGQAGCLDYLTRLALAEPRSLHHYQSFLVAEVAGERAAALCGFETRDGWAVVAEAMSNVQRVLGWTEAEDAVESIQRVAPIWTACMSAYEKSGFQVVDQKRCDELQKILGAPGFVRLSANCRFLVGKSSIISRDGVVRRPLN
jgi:hypothetical protein